jgi:hypothetical protein
MGNFQSLMEINVLAGKHFRDERLSMKGIAPKLRKITDAFLESRGISVKVEPISILDEDFQKDVKSRSRTKTKAPEIEHAIRHHLDVELDDDPDLQASFAEALKKILEEFRDNWNKVFEELEKLRERIIDAGKEPTYGLHRKKQMPFFRMLKKEIFGDAQLDEDAISSLVSLAQQLFDEVERELKLGVHVEQPVMAGRVQLVDRAGAGSTTLVIGPVEVAGGVADHAGGWVLAIYSSAVTHVPTVICNRRARDNSKKRKSGSCAPST